MEKIAIVGCGLVGRAWSRNGGDQDDDEGG